MRIILSCLQSLKRHSLPAYEYWRPSFVNGCREAGIEVLEVPGVDWAEGLVYSSGIELKKWRAETWEKTLGFVRFEQSRQPIDLFLGYLYPQQIEESAIKEISAAGIPCVNFFCDNVREFRKVPKEYYPFALHWVPEFEALQMYQNAGLPSVHAPMPCWIPQDLRRVPEAETEPPTFIGSADILRRELLGRALLAGGDFLIRGPGWVAAKAEIGIPARRSPGRIISNQFKMISDKGMAAFCLKIGERLRKNFIVTIPISKVRPVVSGAEYLRITREAEVTIGVNRVPDPRKSNRHPLAYSRLRDIEAPMLGACYLTEWTAGLAELYEIGKEIEVYRTPDELAAKLQALHCDPQRRRSLRERGQRRALADHSISGSLRRISKHLGVKT